MLQLTCSLTDNFTAVAKLSDLHGEKVKSFGMNYSSFFLFWFHNTFFSFAKKRFSAVQSRLRWRFRRFSAARYSQSRQLARDFTFKIIQMRFFHNYFSTSRLFFFFLLFTLVFFQSPQKFVFNSISGWFCANLGQFVGKLNNFTSFSQFSRDFPVSFHFCFAHKRHCRLS